MRVNGKTGGAWGNNGCAEPITASRIIRKNREKAIVPILIDITYSLDGLVYAGGE